MHWIQISLDSIDSTNTYAKLHASSFKHGAITSITAEEQTGGRGRFEKKWLSPRGVNLYVTFFFRLPSHFPYLSCLSHLAMYSLAQVLLKEGLSPKIKWPNDLLLSRKKLSGVLCELSTTQNEIEVILGMGINVNMPDNLLRDTDIPATSLLVETGHAWDKKKLLQALQTEFLHHLSSFIEKGFAPFHSLCNELLAYKGEKVKVLEGTTDWEGLCEGITIDGKLKIKLPNHTFHECVSGHLRVDN